jgi:NAD(P)-dependent dehydrogenase (short-subunit alcohol dehydrogenase family)
VQSVLVTGASSGIGRAVALRMDSSGWKVFAGVRRDEDARALETAGSERLTPVMLDITVPEQIEAAAESIGSEIGESGLDGLVNNAGITIPSPLEALPIEDLRRLLDVNLVGQVAVTQALLPRLRKASGRIVFVSSISGRRGVPLLGGYSASKSGLGAIVDALRLELRPWDISVSMIEPASIETPIWERGRAEFDAILERIPADLNQLYDKMLTAFRDLLDKAAARRLPPEKVTATIEHALTARRPRTRYLVGSEARSQAIALRLLPDRVIDFAIIRTMGL